jgi:stage V sporulation protein AE
MFIDYVKAFLVGGAVCAIGQALIDRTKITPPCILVSFVVTGAVLGAFGLYKPIIDFAGAGATVPLLGFGNLIATGTLKAVRENGLMGALTGGLTATAAGISAAILFGLISAIIFKPKDK